MIQQRYLGWFLLGLVCGVLLALWLTRDNPPPTHAAAARPPREGDEREGGNISTADFRNEGVGA